MCWFDEIESWTKSLQQKIKMCNEGCDKREKTMEI